MEEDIRNIIEEFEKKKDLESCIFSLHIYMKSLNLEAYKIIYDCIAMGSYGNHNFISISWIDNDKNLDSYGKGFIIY